MNRRFLALLIALVVALCGCPTNAPDKPIDAADFEAGLALDASIDAAPHRLGSFNPTCSGTGVPKVVSGVQTSACATIVNADVSGTAAIAGTKITPDFGSQNIFTNGGYAAFGSPVAAVGTAFRFATNQSAYAKTSGTDRCLWETSDAVLYLGNNASNTSQFSTINIYGGGTGINLGADASATTYLQIVNTQISAWKPIVGSSGGSSPYSVHGKVADATAGSFSITGASYQYDAIQLTGGTAGTVTFPAPGSDAAAYYKTIINTSGVTKTLSDGGASTPTLATALTGRYLFDTAGVHLVSPTVAYP